MWHAILLDGNEILTGAFMESAKKSHFCFHAVLAQSVARRLGKAEVGGSSPLGSLSDTKAERLWYFFYFLGEKYENR